MSAARHLLLLSMLAALGCNRPARIDLDYQLTLPLDEVLRVQTVVDVDASDPRMFYGDKEPFRYVAPGVYVVVDDFGKGRLQMLIKHDTSFGFVFSPAFTFTLLGPTEGALVPLSLRTVAIGRGGQPIADTGIISARFDAKITLVLSDCGGVVCAASEACCNGACSIPDSDPANCGGCGIACGADEACRDGRCHCELGPSCVGGQACCPAVGCIDLTSDPFHCGTCDRTCNPGETCAGGTCACGSGGPCQADQVCCDGVCSSTECVCNGGACPPTAPKEICCGASPQVCTSTASDLSNCGACGKQCPTGLSCTNGECACRGTVCLDTCCPSGCSQLDNDPQNCGGCGRACQPGFDCTNGRCTCAGATCLGATDLCCAGACTAQSVLSCGTCTQTCKTGETCAAGACQCGGGAACVGSQTCCSDGCFDLTNDPSHCGSCTTACPMGFACQASQCVPVSGCTVTCSNSNDCSGATCSCAGAPACAGTQYCCNQLCTDTLFDSANCGACGHPCGTGERCCAGTCTAQTPAACGCPPSTVVCPINDVCNNGKCFCGGVVCGVGKVCCGGVCKADCNCGACYTICP